MGATTPRSGFALLLSAALLAGLMVVSAVAVGADDDDAELKKAFEQAGLEWFDSPGDGADDDATPEPAVGVDALSGLSADLGSGDTSDPALTGDLNDPLAGRTGGTSDETETEATGAEPGTTEGSDPTDPTTSSANPMFKLMLDLILEDVQAAEAEAKASGKTLTEAQRSAVAAESVKDLITFLQETRLLGEVDKRELLKQIEGIPTEPEE